MYYVYIITNKPHGVLYIGVTNSLARRIQEHKQGQIEGFSKKYNLKHLVWFDYTENVSAAIQREKQMKAWKRQWKIDLIQESNPEWRDLADEL